MRPSVCMCEQERPGRNTKILKGGLPSTYCYYLHQKYQHGPKMGNKLQWRIKKQKQKCADEENNGAPFIFNYLVVIIFVVLDIGDGNVICALC